MNLAELICRCGDHHWSVIQENQKVSCGDRMSFFCMGCDEVVGMEVIRIGYVTDPDLRKIFKPTDWLVR